MEWLLKIGIGIVVVVAAFLLYDLATARDPRADLGAGMQSVKRLVSPDAPAEEPAPPPDKPTPAPAAPKVASAKPSTTAPGAPSRVPAVADAAPSTKTPTVALPSAAARPLPARTTVTSTAHYLAGNMNRWTAYDVTVTQPTVIRAGGSVSTGSDTSGPGGLSRSNYERMLRTSATRQNARVSDAAPYLSLIGRVCSDDECSPPFVVGSATVVCPADLKTSGRLQLWTNNYIKVGGSQTLTNYSIVTGGFSITTEPASASACATGPGHGVALPLPSLPADPGDALRRPEFVVSSSQTSWKPFFLPMDAPMLVRATGSVRPRESAQATGPDGVPVDRTPWTYPGSPTTAVDADHPLFAPALPYQALIGRFCGADTCGAPFLVGHERTVCPAAPYTDHLELWINLAGASPGLLGSQTPLTMQTLELQTRLGAYTFAVSRGEAARCTSAAAPSTR